MEKIIPSIFNDVIGPVMRGPSSSHVAAASRMGKLINMSAHGKVKEAIVDFDVNGSLAESYDGHGSDIGLVSGLLGIELTDERVPKSLHIAKENDVNIVFNILDYGAVHPNNYRMLITADNGEQHLWEAISTGGGMIEIQKIDHLDVEICGDYYEALIVCENSNKEEVKKLVEEVFSENVFIKESSYENRIMFEVKYADSFNDSQIEKVKDCNNIIDVIYLDPILPTKSCKNCQVPFRSATELLEFAKTSDREMWELATLYESKRGNVSEDRVFEQMSELVTIMENCVKEGIKHNEYKDRILGQQSDLIDKGRKKNILVPAELISNIVRNVTAVMEMKSSMGVIIAAPTAGACAGLPGTMVALEDTYNISHDEIVKGMLVAGLIGIFIVNKSTFAAEVAGCQAECGSASGMAAAGISQVFGGTVNQCVDAASMALQSITGLVCDPVANRVEVPCLGKNVMAGSNAVSSATMALAGFDKVIPLDETIEAIYDIGTKLPIELRCTYGGLGKTATSNKIRKELEDRK